MFRQSSRRTCGDLKKLIVLVPLLFASAHLSGQSGSPPDAKNGRTTVFIQGRVLAAIDSPFHGAGLGPKYESFIFGGEQTNGDVRPIKIWYAYFGRHTLPVSFFNYTTRYELAAVRQISCDETVSSLSLIKSVGTSGLELPSTNVLRPLNGAPINLLKPDKILPCYIVREGSLKPLPFEK